MVPKTYAQMHLINNKTIKNKTEKPSSPLYEDYLAEKAKNSSTPPVTGPVNPMALVHEI